MQRSLRERLRTVLYADGGPGRDGRPVGDGGSERAGRTATATDGGQPTDQAPGTDIDITTHYAGGDARLDTLGNGAESEDLHVEHVTDPTGMAAADVEQLVESYCRDGVDVTTFVGTNRVAASELVAAAFAELRDRLDPAAQAELDEVESQLDDALV